MTIDTDSGVPATSSAAAMGFEEAFKSLEAAVRRLEDNALTLDEALLLYEEGAGLADRCAALLEGARLRLTRLTPGGAEVAAE